MQLIYPDKVYICLSTALLVKIIQCLLHNKDFY